MTEIYKVDQTARKFFFEGVQGENESRSIQFDITPWTTELGNGAVTATAKRPTDAAPYPVTVTRDGNTVTWKPTSTDTAFDGVGSFQLEYTVDSVLAKTCIWSTMVAPSLDPAGDPPDPYDNWLAEMRQIAADALQDAQDADASAQDAEAWAKGTKNGTPVPSTADQYENNAKYFAEESYKNAEAWAVGQRGGVDVPSTDPAYENNAKYWAGQAEDLKDATQAIVDEARADVFDAMDGLHEETTAGSALQLISDKYTENKEPYVFRKSIAGDRELDTLVGGSVAWNQLQANTVSRTVNDITYTYNDGTLTVSGTATATAWWLTTSATKWNYIKDHVYLFDVGNNSYVGSASTYMWYPPEGFTVTNMTAPMEIKKASSNASSYFQMYVASGYTANITFKPQVFDLTAMFGTAVADILYAMEQANAGSGVALFRSWFHKEYYAHNQGELMSVKTTAHEMVGFNQWDGEYMAGKWLADVNGTIGDAVSYGLTSLIEVFPNTTYYKSDNGSARWLFYDENENAIPIGSWSEHFSGATTFTTPSNARYVRFSVINTSIGSFIVNLSSDRNGEYEPYQKRTYALDGIELRGVPKVASDGSIYWDGDRYGSDGKVDRRYGIVDLGTLDWYYHATTATFWCAFSQSPYNGGLICPKYVFDSTTSRIEDVADKTIWHRSNAFTSYNLCIKDSAYTDGVAFKTAMSGVYLVYELATPTTENADPFTSPQIVDAYGTERYVDERAVAVPVGHVTKYPDNLREKLDGLPWDFSTLIAPTEKAYTATRNYTAGSLFIVGNILYKATANIANGGTITPNTNCTATTLAEVISAL